MSKHAASNTREYYIWGSMVQRCTNPNNKSYANYGKRGIRVCERWLTFANFIADMGFRDSPNHSLDRINNNGPYSPENCRWTDRKTQIRNSRIVHNVEFNGESHCLERWAEVTGIPAKIIGHRLRLGWTPEKTFTTPYKKGHKYRHDGESSMVNVDGRPVLVTIAASVLGIPKPTLYWRLKRGIVDYETCDHSCVGA